MRKFRLTMWVGNCENFGTEWETLEKRVKIVEAEDKEDVENKYGYDIYDCDCRYFKIEELGAPCFKLMVDGKLYGQYETMEKVMEDFWYCLQGEMELEDAVGRVKIEVGIWE